MEKINVKMTSAQVEVLKNIATEAGYEVEYSPFCDSDGAFNCDGHSFYKKSYYNKVYEWSDDNNEITIEPESEFGKLVISVL